MKNNPPPDVLPFDCFVEDLRFFLDFDFDFDFAFKLYYYYYIIIFDISFEISTNGSFVNGKRQSKDDPSFLRHGDEISLGSRFTTQEKPEVATFVGT